MTISKIDSFNSAVAFILDKVRFNHKGNTLHGSQEYKQGFMDGYKECLASVEGTKGQYATQVGLAARAAAQREQKQ